MVGQIASLAGTLPGSSTQYVPWQASLSAWNSSEGRQHNVMPCSGAWSKLRVGCVDPGGVTESRAFTLRVGLADSALTCTVSTGATKAQDGSNSVSVSAGNLIDMKQVTSAGVAVSADTWWTAIFTATNANEFPCMWSSATGAGAGATRYAPYQGDGALQVASAAGLNIDYLSAAQMPAGTLTNLYVHLDSNQATSSQVITVYLNGAPTNLTVTIAAGASTGNDTTHTVTVAEGDLISYELVNNGSTAPRPCVSTLFKPTTNGECPAIFCQSATHPQNVTRYNSIGGGAQAWSTTESPRQMGLNACTVEKLYFQSDPANLNTTSMTVRKNTADGTVTQTVTGATVGQHPPVAGHDTTHTDSFADDDLIAIKAINSLASGATTTQGMVVLLMSQPATNTKIGASNRHMPRIGVR